MKKVHFFRVSANEYKENDIIYPSDSSYSERLDEPRNIVEGALNESSPRGKRAYYLFLFDSLENAFLYLVNHASYNRIYLVDIECEDCVTKCDMNFITGMMYLVKHYDGICESKRTEMLNAFAKDYWDCAATESPCYEYLVKKATVKECIFFIEKKQHVLLKKEYGENGRRILELEAFRDLYKKVYL